MREVDVDGMLERISSQQFIEWHEYFKMAPFGEEMADLRNAMLMCFLANALRGKKQRKAKLEDFLPRFDAEPTPRRQSPENMKATLMAFAQVQNAFVAQKAKGRTVTREAR